MSFIEFEQPSTWSLDANKTGESTKCLWAEVVALIVWRWRGGRNRETFRAFLCCMLAVLAAPATATPVWLKGQ